MSAIFVVVDIGCIECGEGTSILGAYSTREEAEAAHELGDYFSGGQHSIECFMVESP